MSKTHEDDRLLSINSTVQGIGLLLTTAALFGLYGYLYRVWGREVFGIWALISALGIATQLAGSGVARAVTYYVATSRVSGTSLSTLYSSGRLLAFSTTALVAAPLWAAKSVIVELLVAEEFTQTATSAFHYGILAYAVGSISSTPQAILEGLEKVALRVVISFPPLAVFVALSIAWAKTDGVEAVAFALLVQNCIRHVLLVTAAKIVAPTIALADLMDGARFAGRMVRYAIHVQAAGVMAAAFEPLAKFALSAMSGVTLVADFDLGGKLISKLRDVVVTALGSSIPTLTRLKDDIVAYRSTLSKVTARLVVSITLGASFLSIFSSPIFHAWLGSSGRHAETLFLFLVPAWTISAIASPLYWSNLANGQLRPNTLSHCIQGVVLLIGASWQYATQQQGGTVVGFCVGLVSGALLLFFMSRKTRPEEAGTIYGCNVIIFGGVASTIAVASVAARLLTQHHTNVVAAIGAIVLATWTMFALFGPLSLLASLRSREIFTPTSTTGDNTDVQTFK